GPHGRSDRPGAGRAGRLVGSELLPAGNALGLSGTGLERRPFLPRRRRPPARPSPGPGTTSVLPRNRRLRPGPQAPARVVLRRGGAPHGTGPGCPGRSAVAVETAARLPLGRVLGLDARHAEESGRVPAARHAEARPRLPAGTHRRSLLARLWGGS